MQTRRTAAKSRTRHLEFAETMPAVPAHCPDRLSAAASLVPLGEGLYALIIGETTSVEGELSGFRAPIVQVSAPPDCEGRRVEIIGTGQQETWLRREGGTVILRSPPGGGQVVVTAYGLPPQLAEVPPIEVERLDRSRANGGTIRSAQPPDEPHEIRTEIIVHMERLGDRRARLGRQPRQAAAHRSLQHPPHRNFDTTRHRIHGTGAEPAADAVGHRCKAVRYVGTGDAADRVCHTVGSACPRAVRRCLRRRLLRERRRRSLS
jgi:hypothetical protein